MNFNLYDSSLFHENLNRQTHTTSCYRIRINHGRVRQSTRLVLSFLAFDLTLEIDRDSKLIRATGVKSSISISSGRRPQAIRVKTRGKDANFFSPSFFF